MRTDDISKLSPKMATTDPRGPRGAPKTLRGPKRLPLGSQDAPQKAPNPKGPPRGLTQEPLICIPGAPDPLDH